ncbi:MAG TPA: hypothetical protein VFS36_07020 [Chitinophagaceae bacterium]|jgi:hypothetical protein|nr:hypothetical protein [Chitinophagaceae bacterium]
MISTFSHNQLDLYELVQQEWKNRTYNYKNSHYEKDCKQLISLVFKEAELEIPALIFLDSPLAASLAYMVMNRINKPERIERFSIMKLLEEAWDETLILSQSLNNYGWYIENLEDFRKQVLNQLRHLNLNNIATCQIPDGGNIFHNLYWSRNAEDLKKEVSHHIWEYYFPNDYGIGGEFMTSSLNIFKDENRKKDPWNYECFIFYDFMSRLGVMKDSLFNLHKSLLLKGVFDFFISSGFCFVCKLPVSVLRTRSGKLHSYEGQPAVEFMDGLKFYYKKGRKIDAVESIML